MKNEYDALADRVVRCGHPLMMLNDETLEPVDWVLKQKEALVELIKLIVSDQLRAVGLPTGD